MAALNSHERARAKLCKKYRTRENINFYKICYKNLKKYMFLLVNAVERKYHKTGFSFALLWFGLLWLHGGLCSFHWFIYHSSHQECYFISLDIYSKIFALFLNENIFTAANIQDLILETPTWHHLPASNIICLIGEYCNTNCTTTDLILVSLLQYRSNRLNLITKA